MVRKPKSDNGMRSSVYSLAAPDLGSPDAGWACPRARSLYEASQLLELGVPVAASGAAVAVSGEPALLPAPPPISLPPAAAQVCGPGGAKPAEQ